MHNQKRLYATRRRHQRRLIVLHILSGGLDVVCPSTGGGAHLFPCPLAAGVRQNEGRDTQPVGLWTAEGDSDPLHISDRLFLCCDAFSNSDCASWVSTFV